MKSPRLARLQSRFWSVVTAPEGVETALARLARTDPEVFPPVGWIDAASNEEATRRLEIYAGMYFARLVETLRGDYAKLFDLLGSDAFAELARGYLAVHPSSDPSVRHVGGKLPSFLAGHELAGRFPYLPDLAAIEWARVEVFDRPRDQAPLAPEALAGIPAERWPEIRLRPIEGLRLLELRTPADDVWLALDEDRAPGPIREERTYVVVWRKDFSILQRRAGAHEGQALLRAIAGEPFASVCDALEDPADAARLLARWVHEGWFSSARVDS